MWHSCLAFVLAVEQNLEVLLKIAVLAAVFCGLERIHGGPIVLSRTSIRMAALRQKLPLAASKSNFRFTPESRLNSEIAACPKGANCGSRTCLQSDNSVSRKHQSCATYAEWLY